MSIKRKTREDIIEILLSTLLVVGVLAVAITMPNAVQLFKYFGKRTPQEQWRIRRSITRLEERGLIKRAGTKNSSNYVLTSTGNKQAMRYKLKSMTIARQDNWDGLWRVIMFDIPESKKSARRALGRAIQKLGCIQYQKSVFITPYPCEEEIDFVGNFFGTRKYIRIMTVKKLEDSASLNKQFGV